VTVAVVLAVAGLALGASALVLPFGVPGYAGSFAHRAPQSLYDQAIVADLRYCAGAYPLSQCPYFLTSFAGFDNLSVPFSTGGLGVVNVSFELNHSCNTCFVEIFRGNLTNAQLPFPGFPGTLFLPLNGTGSTITLLPQGVDRILVVNESQGSYWGPVTVELKVLYLGPLSLG
jgi:hypothetical protein